jgi:hypothetical protein
VREVVNTFLVPSASVPGDSSGEWTVPAGFCTTEVRPDLSCLGQLVQGTL